MIDDPIVAEIRRIREENAARFNFDVRAIAEDVRKREANREGEVYHAPESQSGADQKSVPVASKS